MTPPDRTICIETQHITCYDYTVENIALMTPLAGAVKPEGWNEYHPLFRTNTVR